MTFTPGSFDPERTDTIEAQKKLQEDDVSAQEEFDKAQRPINFLYKAGKAASDLFGPEGLGDLFDWLKGRAEGKQEDIPVSVLNVLPKDNTKALVSQTSTITPSVLDIFGGTATPAQKKLINNLKLKLNDKNKNIYDGLEGEEVIKKYYEEQDRIVKEFQEREKGGVQQKGEGDPKGVRSEQLFGNRSYWENLPTRSQNLFLKAGLSEDQAIFFLKNFDNVSRDQAAALQDPDYTSASFELMKKDLLPGFLEEMKGVKNLKPQLDHINQLHAALPLYDGTTFNERKKLNQIVLGEGIYAGHSPGNLQFLDQRVHVVKSNYFNDLVGKNGEKFWPNYDLSTFEGKVKAAKEYAAIVKNSYKIVEDANKANLALYKENLLPEEVSDLLFAINPYSKYTIKQLKNIIKDIKEVRSADIEANMVDLDLMIKEDIKPSEFFRKYAGTRKPRGRTLLKNLLQFKNDSFDDKFYQPLLDESFNYID
tara:strand:- start:45 stop:1481 length:1437 start_codon:yes stop_codon:yes gene_type:complete